MPADMLAEVPLTGLYLGLLAEILAEADEISR
jgi:hypothetical protein